MRRGPKAKSKETKPAVARKSSRGDGPRVRELEKRLAEAQEQLRTRDRELAESQEQQTATAEILRVISSSPTDVQPVFNTIIRNAVQLCGARLGTASAHITAMRCPRASVSRSSRLRSNSGVSM